MYKAKSLSLNVTANMINQVSATLFPLLTFPYVTRVLKPEGLGRVSFAEAVVYYFVIVAMLGIPIYGIRESARHRDDKTALSTVAAELFLLNMIMTGVALTAFGLFLVFSRKARLDPALFCICALPILAAPIGFTWLLCGLEEYVYITLQTLAVRILVVISVFFFIRTEKDYRIYALIAALNVVAVALVNMVFVRKYISVRMVDWKRLDVWRHVKPALIIFSFGGVVSIYTSLNRVMLGYMANDTEVGFYSAADRVIRAVIVLVTGMGGVLLPRASYYIEREKLNEYRRLTALAVRFVLFISFPAAAGLVVCAGPLMFLLSGHAFEPAVPLVHIMGLSVILTALGHFLGYHVLYSQGKERLLLYSVVLGAVASLSLNWFLIPRWHATGAALSTLIAETCVTGVRVILSRTCSHFTWPVWGMLKYGLTALAMALVVLLLRSFLAAAALRLLLPTAAGVVFYLMVMWLLKDSMLSEIWNRLTTGVAAVRKASRAEI